MKTIKLILVASIVLLLSISCEKEEAYYRFTSQDNQRLLSYEKGQILKFKNQNNEERTFSIYTVTTSLKTLYAIGMGFWRGSAGEYFYYDEKEICLIDSKTGIYGSPFRINFHRFPLDIQSAKENIYAEYTSKFYASINYMNFWNGGDGGGESGVLINYEQKKIEMVVNGKKYKNVFILTSNNDSIIEDKLSNGKILYKDVNVIYYDEIEGIIGFDDLYENEWRLVN